MIHSYSSMRDLLTEPETQAKFKRCLSVVLATDEVEGCAEAALRPDTRVGQVTTALLSAVFALTSVGVARTLFGCF